MPKKRTYNRTKEVKAIARERIGQAKPSRPIEPKETRRRPKHKKPAEEEI
jgi:hypothetical protein